MLARLRTARATGGYERWKRRTETPLLALALVFLVVLLVELAVPERDLPPAAAATLTGADVLIWSVFAVDYAARLYLARERWRFVRTHPLDLLVILLPALRPLRALQVLRLARLGSVVGIAHRRARRSLHARVSSYVVCVVVVVLAVAAVAMYDAERDAPSANITSVPDALWWAVTTVTTVGYGDRYPTTTTGRVIAVALMVVGIALLGVVTATIAAWFVDRLSAMERADERTEATLSDVLAELREVRARLETVERRSRGDDLIRAAVPAGRVVGALVQPPDDAATDGPARRRPRDATPAQPPSPDPGSSSGSSS